MFRVSFVFVSTFPLQVLSSPTCGRNFILPSQSFFSRLLGRSVENTVIAARALVAPRSEHKVKVRRWGINYIRAKKLVKDAPREFSEVANIGVHSVPEGLLLPSKLESQTDFLSAMGFMLLL